MLLPIRKPHYALAIVPGAAGAWWVDGADASHLQCNVLPVRQQVQPSNLPYLAGEGCSRQTFIRRHDTQATAAAPCGGPVDCCRPFMARHNERCCGRRGTSCVLMELIALVKSSKFQRFHAVWGYKDEEGSSLEP